MISIPVQFSSGSYNQIRTAVSDITQWKKAEEEIKQRVEELNAANEELTRFNNAAVDRELRMIDLKKEINELCSRAGLPPRYALDSEEDQKT